MRLFKFADAFDVVLMAVGSLAAVAHGLGVPAMVFAVDKTSHESTFMLLLLYTGLAAAAAFYLEASCWIIAGERQARKMRLDYLSSLLRQDVADLDAVAWDGDTGSVVVQEGIGLQAGDFIRNTTQFLACYLLVTSGRASSLSIGFALIMAARSLQFALPAAKRISEACAAAEKMYAPFVDVEGRGGEQLAKVEGRLEFRDVVHRHPSRPLQAFNLCIPAGKTTALVGGSTSTVIALLERFCDPVDLLDGHDIRSLKLSWYRKQIGLVSQEPALFAASVKENILYGKDDAGFDDIVRAATSAGAHSFVMQLPDAYDTQVGELSRGQRQRIALARALIRDPCILLLDEAADGDVETVQAALLDSARQGRTTVVAACKPSTVRAADVVAVLRSGKVVEFGRQGELVERGGACAAAVLDPRSQHDATPSEQTKEAQLTSPQWGAGLLGSGLLRAVCCGLGGVLIASLWRQGEKLKGSLPLCGPALASIAVAKLVHRFRDPGADRLVPTDARCLSYDEQVDIQFARRRR